ncbi:chromate resistance protein ChrB domain-containing protein [Kosakonia sp. SOY2]|uniref:chromate resistance protein ChrB domain-containing protein n=1 Tax=Kosakonia sp. SOY2 TaxID=3014557 RepID=UPI003FA59DAC
MYCQAGIRGTFEELLKRFELENNGLALSGLLVHYLDTTERARPPETTGFKRFLAGLMGNITDDEKVPATASALFEGL